MNREMIENIANRLKRKNGEPGKPGNKMLKRASRLNAKEQKFKSSIRKQVDEH